MPVLEYCSSVLCSAAESHLKLLDRVVRSAGSLAGGVLNCNLAHRRSVAELCMLFKIKSNPMHSLSGALPLPYVLASVTCGALVAHSPRLRLLVVGLLSIAQHRANAFLLALICSFFAVSYYFIFFFLPWVGCVGLGSLD